MPLKHLSYSLVFGLHLLLAKLKSLTLGGVKKISNLNLWLGHTGQASLHEHCLGVGRALKSKDIPPLLPQGVLLIRKVAAFATFKKDTTLERQGEFTLSTLQGSARAGES